MKKILIIRFSSIGDIILTSALIRCVKKALPDAEISFLIKNQFKDLIKHNPYVDKIIPFDKKQGLKGLIRIRKKLVKENYGWVIDIHNNIRSNIIKTFSGVPRKTRFHKRIWRRYMLILFKKNFYRNNDPVMLRYFEAVRAYGIEYDNNGNEVFVGDEDEQKVESVLKQYGIQGKKLAVICPGASFSNKQWHIEGFVKTAEYLFHQLRLHVVLLGGENDFGYCQKISEQANFYIPNLAGKFKLLESGALLKKSSITLTNDSGMMHMAQAQKSPVVAVFGPTTRELGYFPIPGKSAVAEIELNCRPCTPKGLDHCPKKHFKCMQLITSDLVIEKINGLI